MAEHSKYSALKFEADALCPGKPVMEAGLPNTSSEYADEGTAAHKLLDWCLKEDRPALAYKGRRIPVGMRTFEVTEEMAGYVQQTVDHVKAIVGDGMLLSDQRVTYAEHIGVEDDEGWGTADVLGAAGSTLIVADFKYGRGVEVRAGDDGCGPMGSDQWERLPNPQMACYALGALAAVQDVLGPFEDVLLVISQPRISDEPSTYRLTVAELLEWAERVARPAVRRRQEAEKFDRTLPSWPSTFLEPNDKSCRFCKAKATCPALRQEATRTVFAVAVAAPEEFEVLPPLKTLTQALAVADEQWLGAAMAKVDLIDGWLTAIRAEVERRLLAGQTVPGFKPVQGKRGNRQWADPAEAEAALKAMRLKVEEMYDLKLISPTTAEKLHKAGAIGPRQWSALQKHVTQSDGKVHVAPITDPRPAITVRPVALDFDIVADA